MLYGAAVWDPVLIIGQIAAMQCLFYLSLGLFQTVLLAPYVSRLSVVYLFGWHELTFSRWTGWVIGACGLLNALAGAVYLMWIVERAKKCLDFASTCYIIHFVVTCTQSGFPANFEWWLVNGLGLLTMSVLGEWLCLRREMQDIPIGQLRGLRTTGGGSGSGSGSGGPQPNSPTAPVRATGVQLSAGSAQLTAGSASGMPKSTSTRGLVESPA